MGDYVVDPYPHAKFHQYTITPFRPQIRENAHRVTRLVFWFFCQPTAKTPAPIFTINRGRDGAILTPNELVLPFWSFYVCANFGENRSRNATVRVLARRTDTLTD